jgi:drug/metabolite transporter (DMT)-like permease
MILSKTKLYFLVTAVILAWGLNVVATKILVHHFAPVTITACRIFTAGVSVLLLLRLTGHPIRLSRSDVRVVALTGLFNVVAHHYCLSVGLTKTTASNAGLILGLVPLLTALLSIRFLGDRMTWFRGVGIIFGFAGAACVELSGSKGIGNISLGDLFVFLAALAQAISLILIRKWTSRIDGRLLTGWMMVLGAGVLFLISLALEPHGLFTLDQKNPSLWLIFFASAIIATGMGHMIYNRAVQRLGAAETAIFINLNPFFSLLGAYFFLGEGMLFKQVLEFVLIVIGVLFGTGTIHSFRRMKWNRHKKVA